MRSSSGSAIGTAMRSTRLTPAPNGATAASAASSGLPSASSSSDLAARYSFADLGRLHGPSHSHAGSSSSKQEAAGEESDSGGLSGSAFVSSLQARLQAGSIGSIGSMLGDKAADMAAMAQQRFDAIGEFLPAGALGSASGLFSSFTKTAGQGAQAAFGMSGVVSSGKK